MDKSEQLHLPGSGYDVLEKVLHAYARFGTEKVNLSDVAAKSALDKTQISRNNRFLVDLGVLEGGKKKGLTEPGLRLARAIANNIVDEIRNEWKALLLSCSPVVDILDMIKVQKGVLSQDLMGRMASSLGLTVESKNKIGLNTLATLLRTAELTDLLDGKVVIRSSGLAPVTESPPEIVPPSAQQREVQRPPKVPLLQEGTTSWPSVHIDLQVHISPEASLDQIDHVFACIAKYLRPLSGKTEPDV